MKTYQSFEEIEYNLSRLKLERKIALEEMKLLKVELVEDLSPPIWVSTIANVAGKYGLFYLVRRLFKR